MKALATDATTNYGNSIEHLLTMSAGFNTGTLPDFAGKDASFNAVEQILRVHSVLNQPGETFYYDSGLPHVLSTIIQQTSGLTLEEYAQFNLFNPLGITDFSWQSDPQGITNGSTGLSLRPQDMAKLGYLYLHTTHGRDKEHSKHGKAGRAAATKRSPWRG